MRGVGAAVLSGVGAAVVEGTGSGSGTWLRGLGAAVIEGSGTGSKGKMGRVYGVGDRCNSCGNGCQRLVVCNCCPWCCDGCNKDYDSCYECGGDFWLRKARKKPYICSDLKCGKQCKGKELKCECKCCKEKCRVPGACSASALPAPQASLPSPDAQHLKAGQEDPSPSEDHNQVTDSPPFSPDPQVIAAVIVAIIVAIILLDLCIFRFPVGRNIRDFLIRKIPFCIAFYS